MNLEAAEREFVNCLCDEMTDAEIAAKASEIFGRHEQQEMAVLRATITTLLMCRDCAWDDDGGHDWSKAVERAKQVLAMLPERSQPAATQDDGNTVAPQGVFTASCSVPTDAPPAALERPDSPGWYECETQTKGRTVKRAYWWDGKELRSYEGGNFLVAIENHRNFRPLKASQLSADERADHSSMPPSTHAYGMRGGCECITCTRDLITALRKQLAAKELELERVREFVRTARLLAGWGLREFAEKVAIIPSRYCDYENGRETLSDEEIQRVCDCYKKSEPWGIDCPTRARIIALSQQAEASDE